ncbi:beta-lactamase/transpeptidase-like protein [Chytridium lagenaria]|nr:beta-lactamase/transpeptidase-like protein [Chytridium lagenaria]
MSAERQPLLPVAASDEGGLLERAERATRSFSRRALIVVVFLGTLTGTLLLVLLISGLSSLPDDRSINYATISTQLEQLRKDYDVKAFAVGVVRNGKLEYGQGFGSRNPQGDGVDMDTLFEIGSNTKAFTGMGAAILVDDGLLSWNAPISEISEVEFSDPVANKQANIVDLLSHRSGISAHNYFWHRMNISESLPYIKHLKFKAQLREKYEYNNGMIGLAGAIAGNLYHGKGWDSLISERIFEPLGMNRSFTFCEQAQKDENCAVGYDADNNMVDPTRCHWIRGTPGAGVISSSINDFAKWAAVFQEKGKPLVTEKTFSHIVQQHSLTGAPSGEYQDFSSYGLGMALEMYRGKKVYLHTGATFGFSSFFITVPEDKVSVIVFANRASLLEFFPAFVARTILDKVAFPTLPAVDWVSLSRKNAAPALELRAKEFTGIFHYPGYGNLEVFRDDESSLTIFARFVGKERPVFEFRHWADDVFALYSDKTFIDVPLKDGPILLANFTVVDGSVPSIAWPFEPGMIFERVEA